MATKHIKDTTWSKVEKKTIEAIIETKENIKDSEMLDFLIRMGLERIEKDDFNKIKSKSKV